VGYREGEDEKFQGDVPRGFKNGIILKKPIKQYGILPGLSRRDFFMAGRPTITTVSVKIR
jgi:hypothetical protein